MLRNSSKSEKAATLADSELLEALTELANLRNDEAAFERFCNRWPGLAYTSEKVPADVHDIEETKLPRKFWLLHERQRYVREVWEGEMDILKIFLLPDKPPEEVQADYEIKYWDVPIKFDWQNSVIAYEPRTEFQKALYILFRHSALVKVCGNPNCSTLPYFIAAKATQRYCSEQCAELFQREWKRKWWAEHGEQWRRGRKKAKKKAGKKRR
jgi:hypothetical protein